MINPRILRAFNTDDESIRKLFTAEKDSALAGLRKTWEERIEARIHEGITTGLKNYKFYAAADLAWDSNIITKELVPLQMYAQGRIDFKALKSQLKDLSPDELKKFCEIDPDTKEIKDVKLSTFHEVFVNLVRSFITRRTAALAIKYTKLYPYLKFEPLSTSWVAKLRGDVLSQRIEMVTNQYGYRHDLPQTVRDMLLYGHSIEFAAGAWDVEKQIFEKERAEGFNESNKIEMEARVVREGVLFSRPHPTRTFYDTAYAPATFNTDTGCSFGGYWNVVRFRDVDKNPNFFNRSEVAFNQTFFGGLAEAYRGYWELYFPSAPINFPGRDHAGDLALANDREANVGRYTPEQGDQSVALVEYRERVVPKDVGLGDYPYPVWVRLVVAGGRTVVFGEILPSLPAIYWGFNEDDNRLVNNAWAHDILPFGDQLSNMLSQLLLTQKTGLLKVLTANIDLMTDDQLQKFRKILTGQEYCTAPILMEFKGEMMRSMGVDTANIFKMHETTVTQDVTQFFRSIMQLLALAERVLGVSAQELGQSAPREISATEVAEISNTTNTTLSYMGLGVDEALDAKKRLLYEAFVAKGCDKVFVPVVNRYSKATIKAAGFEFHEEDDTQPKENYADDDKPEARTIVGSKHALIYDYNFSSRDGSERASNAKSAEVLVNLLSQLLQIPGVLQDMGKEKLYQFLTAIVRMSGAGVDLSFDMQEGEPDQIPPDGETAQGKEATQQAIRMIMDAIQQDREKIAQIESMLTGQPSAPQQGAPAPGPQGPPPAAAMPAAA